MTNKEWALMSWLYIGTVAEPKAIALEYSRHTWEGRIKARVRSLARRRAQTLKATVYVTDEHGAEIYCAEYVTPKWHGADMGPIIKAGF